MSHFSSFKIRFALKGINTLYYRETGKIICHFSSKKIIWIQIPEETEYCLLSSLRTKRGPLKLFLYTLLCKIKMIAGRVIVKLYR